MSLHICLRFFRQEISIQSLCTLQNCSTANVHVNFTSSEKISSLVPEKASYTCANVYACAFSSFQNGNSWAGHRLRACHVRSAASQATELSLSGQQCSCCKLQQTLAKKKAFVFVWLVTAKKLVCKNGHSLVQPPFCCLCLRTSLHQRTILLYRRPRLRRNPHSHFSVAVVYMLDKTISFRYVLGRSKNRDIWKAFACRYAPPRSCCSCGTAEAHCCIPTPRRLK